MLARFGGLSGARVSLPELPRWAVEVAVALGMTLDPSGGAGPGPRPRTGRDGGDRPTSLSLGAGALTSRCRAGPLVPCAMVGAVAALSGYDGLGVAVHGSSGCWFYPSSLLRIDLGCTDISSADAVLGAEERARETVEALLIRHRAVAIVNTCIPGIAGEDLAGALADLPVTVVDAPGFLGGAWTGHARAIASLRPAVDDAATGDRDRRALPARPLRPRQPPRG